MRRPAIIGIIVSILSFTVAPLASAHEAYVLPASEFDAGLKIFAQHPFAPLVDAVHLHTFLFIALCVAVSYILSFLWSTTSWSDFLDRSSRKPRWWGRSSYASPSAHHSFIPRRRT